MVVDGRGLGGKERFLNRTLESAMLVTPVRLSPCARHQGFKGFPVCGKRGLDRGKFLSLLASDAHMDQSLTYAITRAPRVKLIDAPRASCEGVRHANVDC